VKIILITGGLGLAAIAVVFGWPLFCMMKRFLGWRRLWWGR
jgi:hypothetical protein